MAPKTKSKTPIPSSTSQLDPAANVAAGLWGGSAAATIGKKLKLGTVTGHLTRAISIVHENIGSLNNSKYCAGMVMIMLNLGAKVVSVNFSSSTQEYLKYGVSKQLFIFSMAWMGTRDIYTSVILTAVFTVLSEHLFNEESRFCVVPEKYRMINTAIDTNNDGIISEEELKSALKVLEKAKTLSNGNVKKPAFTTQ
jgi:hypothetical protein